MLDYIRTNAQSFGVKLLFGIIIIVFVFWGIGALTSSGPSGRGVLKVNGETINYAEFERAYGAAEEMLLQRSPGMTREQLRDSGLGVRVMQQLLTETLLRQEAERVGIAISAPELRDIITRVPLFRDKTGKFDIETYKNILAAQRMTPGEYEENIRKSALQEKVERLMTSATYVPADAARQRFDFINEERVVNYIYFPAANYMEDSIPDEQAVRKYYDEHKDLYAVPAKVDLEYVAISPATLAQPDKVSDATIAEWYETRKEDFATPERRRVRHILFVLNADSTPRAVSTAEANARDVRTALSKGGNFAALAARYSQDVATAGKGGEIGWIKMGDTVKPFEKVVFALQEGETSEVVRSEFGLHIIRVEAIEPSRTRALSEVQKEVREAIAQEEAANRMRDVLDIFTEGLLLGQSLQELAQKENLKVAKTGSKSAVELTDMGLKSAEVSTVMAAAAGTMLETPLAAGNDVYWFARIAESSPEKIRPFEEVEEEITVNLTREKARQTAFKEAADARKNMLGRDLPVALRDRRHTSEPMPRTAALPGFLPNEDMNAALFNSALRVWLPTVYTVMEADSDEGGAVLVQPLQSILPDDKKFEPLAEIFGSTLEQERKDAMLQMFFEHLFREGNIEILDSAVIERKNM